MVHAAGIYWTTKWVLIITLFFIIEIFYLIYQNINLITVRNFNFSTHFYKVKS